MLSTNQIVHAIRSRRKQLQADLRRENNNAELTDEQLVAIDQQVEAELKESLLNEPLGVEPEKVVEYYKTAIPGIRVIPENERIVREETRTRAVIAYAAAKARIEAYTPGQGNFKRERMEQRLAKVFTPEELAQFVESYPMTKQEYYDGKGMSEEEIREAIDRSKKEVGRLVFTAIKRTVDECERLVGQELSDDYVIDHATELMTKATLTSEAVSLLKADYLQDYRFEEFTPEDVQNYINKADYLSGPVGEWQARLAVMAEPLYPYVNLENIGRTDVDPRALKDISEGDGMSPDAAEILDVKQEENIIGILDDFSSTLHWHHTESLNKVLGMSNTEAREKMIAIDRNGHVLRPDRVMLDLSENGPIYVMSKYGGDEPVPVMLDKTKSGFHPLIGKDAIANAEEPVLPNPEEPGWLTNLLNWFAEMFGGPTGTVATYREQKAKYDEMQAYLTTKRNSAKGNVPNAVAEKMKELYKAREPFESQRNEENDMAALDNSMTLLRMMSKESGEYRRAMGNAIVRKAFLEPKGSVLRTTVCDLLNITQPGYNDASNIDDLQKTSAFKQFLWDLRRVHPDLLDQLGSADRANADQALEQVCEKFKVIFASTSLSSIKIVDEYTRYEKEATEANNLYNKMQPGHVISQQHMDSMDRSVDNAAQWNTILNVYGAKREVNPKWIAANIFDKKHFDLMQQSEVDLDHLKLDGKTMDDRTFAALGMVMSQRSRDWFNSHFTDKEGNRIDVPYTMPLEDILLDGDADRPRANTRMIVEPLIEPTRKNLLNYLNNMDRIIPESDPPATGRQMLAKDLTDAMKLYINSASTWSYSTRAYSTLPEVGQKVMEFAKEHDLIDAMKQYGLDDKDLEKLQIINAMGKIAKEGFDAQRDLLRDAEKVEPLTVEQRRACVDKLARLKALQADMRSTDPIAKWTDPDLIPSRENFKGPNGARDYAKAMQEYAAGAARAQTGEGGNIHEYSPIGKNLLKDGFLLDDLASRMVPDWERKRLEKTSDYNEIVKSNLTPKADELVAGWSKKLMKHPEEESKHRMEIQEERKYQQNVANFKEHLEDLRGNPKYEKVIAAVDRVMEEGTDAAKRLLVSLDDDKLAYLDRTLTSNPGIDLQKALNERFARDREPNAVVDNLLVDHEDFVRLRDSASRNVYRMHDEVKNKDADLRSGNYSEMEELAAYISAREFNQKMMQLGRDNGTYSKKLMAELTNELKNIRNPETIKKTMKSEAFQHACKNVKVPQDKTLIRAFVDQYDKSQNMIEAQKQAQQNNAMVK